LGRLGVEKVDLYLAHEFDQRTPIAATLSTFARLVADGTIQAYGLSNVSAAQLELALAISPPAVVQNSYSLLNRRDEQDVIPLCASRGILYQAYSPLAGGWLSGKYRERQQPAPNSRLALAPQWYEHIDHGRAFAALTIMAQIAQEAHISQAGLALAWVHAQADVSGMVVGPRSQAHFAAVWEAMTCDRDAMSAALTSVTPLFDSFARDV
jgi:aryl-alcohol dehydrogenase-like predicted oxidoreductase